MEKSYIRSDEFREKFLCLWIIFLLCIFAPFLYAEVDLPSLIKEVEPSIVVVLTYDSEGESAGVGSGFFISEDGKVITNRHVFIGAARAEIKTKDGQTYAVEKIVGEDKEGDIIKFTVKPSLEGVRALSVSESDPELGERIIVVGNPLGFERTVSDGIVSAVREIPSFGNIVQITAPISQGSSGSPVINMKGKVIGIAAFLSIEGQNLNFAIPAKRILELKAEEGQTFSEWRQSVTLEWLDTADGFFYLGLSYALGEYYEKAILYFEKVIEKDSHYAIAHLCAGYCYGKLGRSQDAIEPFKKAIQIKPDFADAYYNLGAAYYELSRFQDAIEAYNQAIRIEPDDAEAYYNLGLTYGKLGRFQDAIEAYKQAVRIKPDFAEAYYNLGLTYGELGRFQDEIEAYKQAIRIKPDFAEAYSNMGVAYGELGRFQDVIEVFNQAIRINPDSAEVYHNLGAAYGELGRFQDAIEPLKQAIRIKPDDADAYFFMGAAYGELGRSQDEIEAYKQAIRIKSDYANAYYNMGLTYGKLRRFQDAIEAFKQAIQIKSDYADAYFFMGLAYLMLNDKGSAIDQYKRLKEIDKDLANKLFNIIFP